MHNNCYTSGERAYLVTTVNEQSWTESTFLSSIFFSQK